MEHGQLSALASAGKDPFAGEELLKLGDDVVEVSGCIFRSQIFPVLGRGVGQSLRDRGAVETVLALEFIGVVAGGHIVTVFVIDQHVIHHVTITEECIRRGVVFIGKGGTEIETSLGRISPVQRHLEDHIILADRRGAVASFFNGYDPVQLTDPVSHVILRSVSESESRIQIGRSGSRRRCRPRCGFRCRFFCCGLCGLRFRRGLGRLQRLRCFGGGRFLLFLLFLGFLTLIAGGTA